jgi:Dolichyl-phosphate-mannose-protein mannosyltransferase
VPNRRGLWSLLVCLFVGCYFFEFTKDARFSYFTPDDCLNLYRAWANPAGGLWKAGLLFFRVDLNNFRPIPSAWYRLIFDAAGFNPWPFHAANLLIVAGNIWLTYCLTRRLTGSRETGALAALMISYHGRFGPLYFDTAFVFDALCYSFYFSALLFYIRMRSQDRKPKWRDLAILGALYICALDSKEMALTLPATLALYEWLYHPAVARSWRLFAHWWTGSGRGVLLTSILTLVCVIGRQATGGLAASGEFQPQFSWGRFLETSRNSLTELLFQPHTVSSRFVLLTWIILFAIAWAAKSKPLKFAWLFIMLSVIPVAFIFSRGPAQYYIPLFGWVLYAAAAIVQASLHLVKTRAYASFNLARATLVFLAVAFALAKLNARTSWSDLSAVALEGERFRSIVSQVHRVAPDLRPGARVLFLDDPLDDRWQLTSLMRLSYRDRDLSVDQVKFLPGRPGDAELKRYDSIFSYRGCRFYNSVEPPNDAPQPGIVFDDWCRPAVYHGNGREVTPQRPAKRGEAVKAMMRDLGETLPPSPVGQQFPGSPLAQVTSPLEVRVDGRPAEIWVKIGWPGRVNRYRVDFRLPKSAGPGTHVVAVTSHDATGDGMPVEVK